MADLGPITDLSLLDFDKVTKMDVFTNLSLRPQMAIRANVAVGVHDGIFQEGSRHPNTIFNHHVMDLGVRADEAIFTNCRMALDQDAWFNNRISTNLNARINIGIVRVDN